MGNQPSTDVVEPDRDGASTGLRTTVDRVVAAGQLLGSPRKCAIWHACWLADGLQIQRIAEITDIPQSTTYDLTREMIEEGSLFADSTTATNAAVLKPTQLQLFVSSHPEGIGPQFNVHSTLIGVIGRGMETDDVETFLDRNNYTQLSEAITGVLTILSGTQSEAEALEAHYEWMDSVDARLIEGHIAAVLKQEAKKPDIEWEFPESPVIEPNTPADAGMNVPVTTTTNNRGEQHGSD